MNTPRKLMVGAALGVGLLVAGCGDGSGIGDPAPSAASSVPDSASASGDSFLNFLLSLSGSDETSEPSTISDSFAVPPAEATDPQVLS